MPSSFQVTWDYLCPFARNAHEHIVTALKGGAAWDVRFRYFSLAQAHVAEGATAVWDAPDQHSRVLAGLAGTVVRDRHPEKFLDAHLALFRARHDDGADIRDASVVAKALDGVGLDGPQVVEEALSAPVIENGRHDHDEAVQRWDVFGVPTFIVGDRAVFVRLMTRPGGDAGVAQSTIERVLAMTEAFPELNEYKFTTVPR
jgi:protein-disulfide isomerase-like protein with CxxC motif